MRKTSGCKGINWLSASVMQALYFSPSYEGSNVHLDAIYMQAIVGSRSSFQRKYCLPWGHCLICKVSGPSPDSLDRNLGCQKDFCLGGARPVEVALLFFMEVKDTLEHVANSKWK